MEHGNWLVWSHNGMHSIKIDHDYVTFFTQDQGVTSRHFKTYHICSLSLTQHHKANDEVQIIINDKGIIQDMILLLIVHVL
jgi:hypothetical protein